TEQPGAAWIEEKLKDSLGTEYQRDGLWLFGIFGALHSIWPPEPLLTYLNRAASAAKKKPVIVSIGRMGPGAKIWEQMARDYSGRFTFVRLGEQPMERVSEFLSFIDYGIATSP